MVNLKNLFTTSSWIELILLILVGIVLITLICFLSGWITMLLWNWLVPAIFGLGTITFWQALGLIILTNLIFGRRVINVDSKS